MISGSYSDDAKAIAQANRITLIDGAMLLMMIPRLPAEERDSLLDFATAGDYTTPTCPTCGVKMKAIEGKAGRPDFWGGGTTRAVARSWGCAERRLPYQPSL